MRRGTVRPCPTGTYRCARFGCGQWAVVVETRYWHTGNGVGVGFYGACEAHR